MTQGTYDLAVRWVFGTRPAAQVLSQRRYPETLPALAHYALRFVLRVIHAGFRQFSLKSIHLFSMFRCWRHTLKRP